MPTNYYHYTHALSLLNYYILVVLASRSLHAYALSEQVAHDSGGAVAPARGSLHYALKRLESWGFITSDSSANNQDSRCGVSYTLTPTGQRRLQYEIAHLERGVRAGHRALKQRERRLS